MPVSRWCRHFVVLALAASLSPGAASALDDSNSWAVWMGPEFTFSWPTGSFHPPNSSRSLGQALQASFIPPHFPIGLRLAIGTVEHKSHLDNIRVDNPNGLWVDNLQGVQTGSRLSWGMVGAQWDVRSRESGIYLFAMAGGERISPMEKLGDGYPLIEADVPGLPKSRTGFAWGAGAGARIRIPARDNFAITTEFEYLRLGDVDYVASPGVAGAYPNSRYTVAHGPVETLSLKLGFAIYFTPR